MKNKSTMLSNSIEQVLYKSFSCRTYSKSLTQNKLKVTCRSVTRSRIISLTQPIF